MAVGRVLGAHLAGVDLVGLGDLLDGREDLLEEVRVVVTPHVEEHGRDALQAHALLSSLSLSL